MPSKPGYTLYGELQHRDTAALASVLFAKGAKIDVVPETASLALALASRGGEEQGPYLRTPEGFVLAGLHAVLEWIERVHPEPRLLPETPIRRTCARILEDWIELWLPHWPRRSWSTLEMLGAHLERVGFLLGAAPARADWLLAAWLETEVLVHDDAKAHLLRRAPRLTTLGGELIDREAPSDLEGGSDDVIPIHLLGVLEEIGRDYHAYLALNHQAQKDHSDHVLLDLGLGRRPLPAQAESETRRIEIARELSDLPRPVRRRVAAVLEPLGVWHALTLPPALAELDPADPRSL